MIIEWQNKYNSFNSDKGLTYYQNYLDIMDWFEDDNYLPPPVECNLDPIAECNLNCYFCITQRYLRHKRDEVGEMRQLPTRYMLDLVAFLADWGVRGLCISGGGEPSLHKGIPEVIQQGIDCGMDVAIVTNAVSISDELAEALMLCRWVALSVDAGDRLTYNLVKGRDKFDRVLDNITRLTNLRDKSNSKVDLCYKFLILPENMEEIYQACKLAKEIGVQDFHVRPVDFERPDILGANKLKLEIDLIQEQFAKCHEEETDNFHVYTVTHKFDDTLHVKHDFTQCLASPLVIPILQDGKAYLCVDKKMEANFRLGSCYPNPETILDWWGGNKHRELIKSVNINQCSRCTWSQYNQQIENVILKDGMCLSFP